MDFGIGETGGGPLILKPETSQSVEGGLKGRFLDRRLEAEASGFLMNFDNLVTSTNANGVPSLINSGKQQFRGFESGIAYFFPKQILVRGTYSFHDATFTNFVQDFNGVPVQLSGRRLQMSARNLAAVRVQYSPAHGFLGGFEINYTGNQYLDMLNTALTGGFANIGLHAGYRTRHWELRVDGSNLFDRRDPVAASELGDAQFYLLPARRIDAGLRVFF
jgi:iron complex outermembrane receptor protein